MIADRIEGKWIDAFCEVFARCAVKPGDTAAILSETQSRALNVHLAELALLRLGARPFRVVVPTARNPHPVPMRSTGASEAIGGLAPVVQALAILMGAARILAATNEHPAALERPAPDDALAARVRAAAKRLKATKTLRVTSAAGTDLGH